MGVGFSRAMISWLGGDDIITSHRQRQGVEYEKTFSLVAMIKLIRIFLAIAAPYDYGVW